MSWYLLFVAAFGLGFVFNAAPGPVFAETLRRGLRGGFSVAMQVQLGSLVGDATWALLGLLGVGLILQVEGVRLPLACAGAVYLVWLGVSAWRDSGQPEAHARSDLSTRASDATHATGAFGSGAMLSLTNPQNIAYWAALGSALGTVGVQAPTVTEYGVFFAGFMVASIAWCFICAWGVDWFYRRATASWMRWSYRLCALIFFGLAAGSLLDAWRALGG